MGGGHYNLYDFVDDLMSKNKDAGGIGVNWLIFGSNGHETKPQGGVLKNFTKSAQKNFPANFHIKTICDPTKILSWTSPHFPNYLRGFHTIDENGNIINGAFSEAVNFKKIRINHYFTKSKQEFMEKRMRGVADSFLIRPIKDFENHDRNEIEDTEILEYI